MHAVQCMGQHCTCCPPNVAASSEVATAEEQAAMENSHLNQHFFKTIRRAVKSLRETDLRITTKDELKKLPYFGDHTVRVCAC